MLLKLRNFVFHWIGGFSLTDRYVRYFLTFIASFLLIFFIGFHGAMLSRYATTEPVLRVFDEDSSYGVETYLKTQWWNHNGSRTYGPLYYRLASPLRYIFQVESEQDIRQEDVQFKNGHFYLLMLNLIFGYLVSFLLIYQLTSHFWLSFYIAPFLLALFFKNKYRVDLLYMAKPDWMVGCLIAVAGYFLWESGRSKLEEVSVKKASFAWAMASLTKLLTLFFGPSFLIYFSLYLGRSFWKKFWFFSRMVLIFYLIIGFPQSLDIRGYIKYLIQQNHHTSLVGWNFLSSKWVPLFWEDFYRPSIFLFVLAIVLPFGEDLWSGDSMRKRWVDLFNEFVFVALAIIILISKEIRVPFEWYTFGFVNLLLLWWIRFLKTVKQSLFCFFAYQKKGSYHFWSLLGLFFLLPFSVSLLPKSHAEATYSGFKCRSEFQAAADIVDTFLDSNKKIFIDQHIPFHQLTSPRGMVFSTKENTEKDFLKEDIRLVGFYEKDFLVNKTSMHQLFLGKASVVDSGGREWKRIYQDSCGVFLWSRENDFLQNQKSMKEIDNSY